MRSLIFFLIVATVLLIAPYCLAGFDKEHSGDDYIQMTSNGCILVKGVSGQGQNESMAVRAATLIAHRNVLEIVKGFSLRGSSSVTNAKAIKDVIEERVEGFLKGLIPVRVEYDSVKKCASVWVKYNTSGTGGMFDAISPVINMGQEDGGVNKKSECYQSNSLNQFKDKIYDGLIIEICEKGFDPYIKNRILSENKKCLFDPAMVKASSYLERGVGGYLDSVQKARKKLLSWGCSSPLILKCKSLDNGIDVILNVYDSALVYKSNLETNFLAQAKIVYVFNPNL